MLTLIRFQTSCFAILMFCGSVSNEALENEDRSRKHSELESEAPEVHPGLNEYIVGYQNRLTIFL